MRKVVILIVMFLLAEFAMGSWVLVSQSTGTQEKMSRDTLRKNKPIAEQLTKTNTIYKVIYEFDLQGDTLIIPQGCVLKFKRGKIKNGTIILNETSLEGKKGLNNVALLGTCSNSVLKSDLFNLDKTGVTGNSVDVQSMFNVGVDSIVFSKGTYAFSDIHVGNVKINANGSTFVSTQAADGFSVIKNIFVANGAEYFKLYDATIQGRKEGSPRIQQVVLSPVDLTNVDEVEIRNCTFKELRYSCFQAYTGGLYDYRGVSLSCHGCKNVLVEGCEFFDMMPSEWIWIAPIASGTWNDVENVFLRNNYFHNPKDDYVRSNTPVNVFSKNVVFEGNLLEYQKYAGSAFNLQSRNVIVLNNVVKNSYFKSIVDVCEYGSFCNDYVAIYNNDFSAYNSQAVVANSKELIVKDNKFAGISAVLAYATYYNPEVKHAACADYATASATPNQRVIIEGNDVNCDLVDTTWVWKEKMVHGGYCSGITIQSLYCLSDSVSIKNNRLYIREIKSENSGNITHQPIFIRNAKNIDVSDNHIDSDVPTMGSKYKGAVYILVYNRHRERDAKLMEVESVNIVNNEYNIHSDDPILYTTRISGYSENTAEWKVNGSNISGNRILGQPKREQIFTTGGQIEKLNVEEGKLDLKNSPAKIRRLNNKVEQR